MDGPANQVWPYPDPFFTAFRMDSPLIRHMHTHSLRPTNFGPFADHNGTSCKELSENLPELERRPVDEWEEMPVVVCENSIKSYDFVSLLKLKAVQ